MRPKLSVDMGYPWLEVIGWRCEFDFLVAVNDPSQGTAGCTSSSEVSPSRGFTTCVHLVSP